MAHPLRCIGGYSCLIPGASFTLCMRLPFMILLLWFFVGSFLTVDCFVSLKNWMLIAVHDCGEGHQGVKLSLMVQPWLRLGEEWLNGGSNTTRCVRNASKNSERTSTGYDLAGEDFQNTGTFIVVRSSAFAKSSGHWSRLARDAYNALWNGRRPGQERNCSPGFRKRCEMYSVLKMSNAGETHQGFSRK